MKKKHIVTIVLLVLVFCHNKTNAQIPPSVNYHFCALNGTCYNDANNNNPRVSLILEEYSPQQIIDYTEAFMEMHPQYTLVAPASQLYNCTWSVEPAAMFQVSSGSGYIANLNYKTPFEYLAPKATITYTFSYGCDNHYTVSKEFDLRIPTTTISAIPSAVGNMCRTGKLL